MRRQRAGDRRYGAPSYFEPARFYSHDPRIEMGAADHQNCADSVDHRSGPELAESRSGNPDDDFVAKQHCHNDGEYHHLYLGVRIPSENLENEPNDCSHRLSSLSCESCWDRTDSVRKQRHSSGIEAESSARAEGLSPARYGMILHPQSQTGI